MVKLSQARQFAVGKYDIVVQRVAKPTNYSGAKQNPDSLQQRGYVNYAV